MKKFIRICCCLCMLTVLFSFLGLRAEASEIDSECDIIDDKANYLIPYNGPMTRDPVGTEYLLFSMNFTNVNGLKTTRSSPGNKFFEKEDIPSDDYLYYVGKITSKYGTKAGICFYDSGDGIFITEHSTGFSSGVTTNSPYLSPSNLRSEAAHFGFVKDESGSGNASGYVQFYHFDTF